MPSIKPVTAETQKTLLTAIDGAELVSFDIFDTLIFRPFSNPFHLYLLLDRTIANLLGDDGFFFSDTRLKAENKARHEAGKLHGHQDIGLDDIYLTFQSMTNLTDEQVAAIKQAELDAEMQLVTPNPMMREVVAKTKAQGKKVIFISDMFLSGDFMRSMLEAKGYDTTDVEIFMSSEAHKTKHSGDLFGYVLDRLGFAPRAVLHIGDNLHSDIRNARKWGMQAFHVPRPIEGFLANTRNQHIWRTDKYLSYSVTLGLIANRCYNHQNASDITQAPYVHDWHMFGYYCAGPLYAAFTQWLLRRAKRSGHKALYFLARDGYILKETYKILSAAYDDAPEPIYTLSSRRAWSMARIKTLDTFAMYFLCSECGRASLRALLERAGLDPNLFTEKAEQAGFTLDEEINIHAQRADLEAFFRSIEAEILTRAAEERKALLAYFKEIGLGHDSHQAIVDIGWNGTMQYTLTNLLKHEGLHDKIDGFYLGTKEKAAYVEELGYHMEGFLFHRGEPAENHDAIFSCLEIFEVIFSEPAGGLVHMEMHDGKAVPVLDESDCTEKRNILIEHIHKGALEFVNDFAKVLAIHPTLTLHNEIALNPLREIVTNPTGAETAMFNDVWHVMDVGAKRKIVDKPSQWKLFLLPWAFARQYRNSLWRKGFVQQMHWLSRKYFYILMRLFHLLRRSRMLAGLFHRVRRKLAL